MNYPVDGGLNMRSIKMYDHHYYYETESERKEDGYLAAAISGSPD